MFSFFVNGKKNKNTNVILIFNEINVKIIFPVKQAILYKLIQKYRKSPIIYAQLYRNSTI